MNPLLHMMIVQDQAAARERDLRYAEHRRPNSDPVRPAPRDPVTLRLDTVWDDPALAKLAALAGRRPAPQGRHVVAVIDGEIVAALPLAGGNAYGDPFRRTAHLFPLLELRAQQIAGVEPRRGFRRFRAFAAARSAR